MIKMPIEGITEYEIKPLFKLFLRRIGFKNYDEYLKLFGDDLEKRRETVRRFKKTYPNLFINDNNNHESKN